MAAEAVGAFQMANAQLTDLMASVEANKFQCQRLVTRSGMIGVFVDQIAGRPDLATPSIVVGIKLLEVAVLRCQEQLRAHTAPSWLRRVYESGTDTVSFEQLNRSLAESAKGINADLQVKQIFNPSDDETDRQQDLVDLQRREDEFVFKLSNHDEGLAAQYPAPADRVTAIRRQFQTILQECVPKPKEQRETADSLLEGFIVPYAELKLEKKLGGGAFGEVYLGWWRTDKVAIKVLKGGDNREFMNELKLMAKLRHPNVIQLMAVCLEQGHNALIMEYMQRGSLFDVLANQRVELDWPRRFRFASDIAKGMAYLIGQKILHRDLKSCNVMLREDLGAAKICDFGLSKMLQAKSTDVVGSIRWIAPELFRLEPNTEASDVYGFGMVLYELATRRLPFAEYNDKQVEEAVKKGERPIIPKDVPKGYADVIRVCWDQDPSKRPTFEKIVREQWLEPTTPVAPVAPASFAFPRVPSVAPGYFPQQFYLNPSTYPPALGPKPPPRHESRTIPIQVPQRSVSLAPGAMPRGVQVLPGQQVGRQPLPNYRGAEARVVSNEIPGLQVGQRLILQEAWSDGTARGIDPSNNQMFEFPIRVVRINAGAQNTYGGVPMQMQGYPVAQTVQYQWNRQ
ncbi:kinase-like protein [Gonapodya prolifera JEL478]|uniref:Kinase-like protein n=1 Tax=Gonapodya prolifera (strain JEL478) TaxID=1344416 RepID=A0A139AT53_GONPJ|nr:kinase-like protein [Gonapodya prolifera JEL478]|eukprot:KXS19920.1 kinase-like protein [Gonapodya prolifera JEL478]